jgi:hypothetical protein
MGGWSSWDDPLARAMRGLWGSWGIRKPSPGEMARLGVPEGGRVRMLRAVGIIPPTP